MRCIVGLLVVFWFVGSATAQSGGVAAITSLRERGQFEAAEREGVALWQRADLADRERADLAIELALVVTEQALAAATPEARDAQWAKAERVCSAFVEGWPESPRRRLVEVQRGLVSLARGEQSRALRDLPAAMEHLRAAARQLVAAGDAVGRELVERRLRSGGASSPDSLSIAELESLESHIAYQLARAERQIGLCHPLGSADRDDALLQAVRRLAPIVRQSPPDELVWNARVELVACRRELGEDEVAQKLVAAWMKEAPPDEVRTRFADVSTVSQAEAAAATEEQFKSALAVAAEAREAGQLADAVQAYRRAALENRAKRQAAEAHQAAILCMADLMRASVPADREALLRTYVALLGEHLEHFASQPTADEARLWQGQLLAARQDFPAAIAALQQVRPKSDSFAASVKLVGQCYDSQLRPFKKRPGKGKAERARMLLAATQFLQPIIIGKENRWPESWSNMQREATLGLARLHLRYAEPSSAYAEQLLTAAVRGAAGAKTEAGETWRATTKSLLIAALARRGKITEAQEIANQLENAPPGVLFESLVLLKEYQTTTGEDENRQAIGQLTLVLVRQVDARHTELDEKQLARLDRYRADAFAATGNWAEAATLYAAIAAASPNDGELQEQYAALLAKSDAPAHLRQALARWTTVETRSRRGGERWLRARRARIELLTRLGEQAEAEKLVRLTRLLYPEWDAEQRNEK